MSRVCRLAACAVVVFGLSVPAAHAIHSTVANLSMARPPVPWPQGTGSTHAEFAAASTDGTHVFFTTKEPLLLADTDQADDIYERHDSTTSLVSTGPRGGNGHFHAGLNGISDDGSRAFFYTNESLTTDDNDGGKADAYERSNGETTLATATPVGSSEISLHRRAISADGSVLVLGTSEQLVPEDTDGSYDLYRRSNGVTTLVTAASASGLADGNAGFVGMSRDGAHVFFSSTAPFVPEDTDGQNDVYERVGDTTRLVTNPVTSRPIFIGDPFAWQVTAEGRLYFETEDALAANDTDTWMDLYQYQDGVTSLVATGTGSQHGSEWAGISADGARVYVETSERLVDADTDTAPDMYVRAGDTTELVTKAYYRSGTGWTAGFRADSSDGAHVVIETETRLAPEDRDSAGDVYDLSGNTATLVSTGPTDSGSAPGFFRAASPDASVVLFGTDAGLVPEDTDGVHDLYERRGGQTYLVTTPGPNGGGSYPSLWHASPDLSRLTFVTRERLLASDGDGTDDVYQAGIAANAGYPRPGGASPLRVSLVPAFSECTDPNTRHAAPLAFDACNPPRDLSDHLTVGTPNANGAAARSVGHLRLSALPGDPGTPEDESDIRVELRITDVREQATMADYTGELRGETTLRLTDSLNGAGRSDEATVVDFPLAVTSPCAATTDESIGGTCAIKTTLDSLVPGFAAEGARAVLKIGDVTVFDGGADGDAETPGNSPFAWQGVFVP